MDMEEAAKGDLEMGPRMTATTMMAAALEKRSEDANK